MAGECSEVPQNRTLLPLLEILKQRVRVHLTLIHQELNGREPIGYLFQQNGSAKLKKLNSPDYLSIPKTY